MKEISRETIALAAEGDVRAFEEIYKEFFRFVSNVAFRVVSNYEDAQEITQEVFMIIYRKLKNFRFDSSLKTWIYRVTINSAINYAKKMSRHKKGFVEYSEALSIADSGENIRDKMDEEQNEKMVNALLNELNPGQRVCIVLRSIEGLSYEEIADTLKIPLNTVRSRIKRAREAMLALRKEVVKNEM